MQRLEPPFVADGNLSIACRRTRSSDVASASASRVRFGGAKVEHSLLHKDKLGALHKKTRLNIAIIVHEHGLRHKTTERRFLGYS